jgi:hypothetical protein
LDLTWTTVVAAAVVNSVVVAVVALNVVGDGRRGKGVVGRAAFVGLFDVGAATVVRLGVVSGGGLVTKMEIGVVAIKEPTGSVSV